MFINRYGYASLTEGMEAVIRRHVGGKKVVEMGAGAGKLALDLLRPTVASLLLVEKDDYACHTIRAYESGQRQARTTQEEARLPPFEVRREYAEEGPQEKEQFDVLVLSWPVNYRIPGLLEKWLPVADTIIYIGCNDDHTRCGWSGLFEAFIEREVLDFVKHPYNDLLVLGPKKVTRAQTPAEHRAFSRETP